MNEKNVLNELPERYHLIFHEFEEFFENDFNAFCKHYSRTSRPQIRHILDTGKLVCQKRFKEN